MKTESMFKVKREDLHNFTREENEVLTRVGPATPMGNLMRQYWIPVVPTAHLKEPGGRPLRVSTRFSGVNNATYYTIETILSFYGISFGKIRRWGGKVQECPRPDAPQRRKGIAEHSLTAIFDEGVSTVGGWLDQALENGYEIIPIEAEIVKKLERLGYSGTVLPQSRYRQLNQDVPTIDFSGWALVTHKWLPDRVAYAAIQTIDEKQKFIPVDDDQPLNMRELCQGSEKCPLRVPLHRGAAKYYKEKGYL